MPPKCPTCKRKLQHTPHGWSCARCKRTIHLTDLPRDLLDEDSDDS